MVDITVIVVTHNRAEMLEQTLLSLVNQETEGRFVFEIIVVDDGSTDQTMAVVQRFAQSASMAPVSYIYQAKAGVAAGRNLGVHRARGQWLAFCDDDQRAGAHWLFELLRTALEKGFDCVGGPVVLDLPPSPPLSSLGFRARQVLGEKTFPLQQQMTEKYALGSGNVLINGIIFDRVGFFDISLSRGEDTDFFWRVEMAGYRLGVAPKALVYHVIPESRLRTSYLRDVSLRKGVITSLIQMKYEGLVKLALSMLLRMGIALMVDAPLLLITNAFNVGASVLDNRCRLWYKLGFIRGSLLMLAPAVFPQTNFFAALGLTKMRADIGLST